MSERPKLGIGLAAVARPAYITSGRDRDLGGNRDVPALERRTREILDAAVAAGIGYVDVARSYGRAEEFLARWLADHPEVSVRVGSKWGYRYVGDWQLDAAVHEVKDHSLAAFTEQRDQSLALLGGRLSVYSVHSATPATGVLDDVPLRRELAALRERGIRVGVSTSGPEQAATIRRALQVTADGEPLFTWVQATWNVLETSAEAALAEAADAGACVVVKEALANGRLAPGGQDGTRGVRRLHELAAECGVGADVLAIAAAADRPWASWVLSGAVSTEQLRSNARAVDVVLPAWVRGELGTLAEEPARYWSLRSGRAWA